MIRWRRRRVPSGAAAGFPNYAATSPEDGGPADCLYRLIYTLRTGYRRNARWLMNSATAGMVRRFKDLNGQYLWIDNLAQGQPPLLCGYPVSIDEGMPNVAAGTYPIAFGDFERGYLIADSFGLRITVDDNITTPGQVKFYVRKRVGGKLLDDNAIKVLKIATS